MRDYEIVRYHKMYANDFAQLNYYWINKYFSIEVTDRESLDNPEEKIINPGGSILFVKRENKIVGTCALIKMTDDKYELAKMAISPEEQGKGLGYIIGKAIIDESVHLGAKKLYLESNTILSPAINLYKKLGFKEIKHTTSPYKRSNIQMELNL